MKNKVTFLLIICMMLMLFILFFLSNIFVSEPLKNITKEQYVSKTVSRIKEAYPSLTGKNIKIAIIDSYIDSTHEDLKDSINKSISFIGENESTKDRIINHGTQVAGIISANDNNYGILGVAPCAEIYSLIAIHNDGFGEIKDVCEAIQWCINNKIDIINISFSAKESDSELESLINEAYRHQILVVASYNNRNNISSFPAEYEKVIGVKTNKEKEWFDLGENVVYAPGQNVITTLDKGGYNYVDGNSMAAAYVTGFAAIIKEDCNKKDIDFSMRYFLKILSNE